MTAVEVTQGPTAGEAALAARAVERIRELHSPMPDPWHADRGQVCEHCYSLCHSETGLGCEVDGDARYPCDTIRALDGAPLTAEVVEG